jgi:hypothetical protein
MVSPYLLTGRRRGARRDGEGPGTYVDRPGVWAMAGFSVIVGLSILDAAFTLALLKAGATEANPIMQAALHLGDGPFVFIKTATTVLAAGFLCLHKNWPLGRLCTMAAILGYSGLTAYHIYAQHVV